MKSETALLAKRGDYKTSHVLHFLMSIITAGIWIPIWLLCGISNGLERAKIDRKIDKLSE